MALERADPFIPTSFWYSHARVRYASIEVPKVQGTFAWAKVLERVLEARTTKPKASSFEVSFYLTLGAKRWDSGSRERCSKSAGVRVRVRGGTMTSTLLVPGTLGLSSETSRLITGQITFFQSIRYSSTLYLGRKVR